MIRHIMEVNGEDWTNRLLSANIQFRADAGSSGMEFAVTGSAEDYKDATVDFWLGDGSDAKPYFRGTLQAPNDDEKFDRSSARAYGPFKDMAEQVLGTNETFVGNTLEYVILHCARRTDRRPGDIVVINGRQYRVQQGEQFPFDNKIADVLNTLMGKANFVAVDQPGGRREFMPKPRPGSNVEFKRNYDPGDYRSFSINPSNETNFSKVVVYRNGDNGKPVVYAERDVNPIGKAKPARNRWFVVSDFAGTQKEAGDEAFRLALELRMGLNGFGMVIDFDRSLRVFDGIRVVFEKRGVMKTYACFIDDGFTVTYAPGSYPTMDIGGKAHEIVKDRMTTPVTDKRVVMSPAVLRRPAPPTTDIDLDDPLINVDSADIII